MCHPRARTINMSAGQERSFSGKVALITGISLCFLDVGEYCMAPLFLPLFPVRERLLPSESRNFMGLGDLPDYSYSCLNISGLGI